MSEANATTWPDQSDAIRARMLAAGVREPVIRAFLCQVSRLRAGEKGMIPQSSIRTPASVADAARLPPAPADASVLDRTLLIKLNGGLGTGMGLDQAKSLLVVKDGLTFLDIIARHVLRLRETQGARLPLLLMNSFRTEADTLASLAKTPALGEGQGGIPLSFLQNKVPKLLADSLAPAVSPEDEELAWCPPGHGDIYTALSASGTLDLLLDQKFRYAFVSNADNLGATLDLGILAHFAQSGAPFMMEVTDRTLADRKGGHLAQSLDGQLLLRERAQCPEAELEDFEDIERFSYFNTNNLWIDLEALAEALQQGDGQLDLPLIVNRKTLNPAAPESPAVLQLESAMGAAIANFKGATALRVDRHRFSPVKTTDDLLAVRSDAFELTTDWRVQLHPDRRHPPPTVHLDSRYYKTMSDFDRRFPGDPPSLRACRSLRVEGDIVFGQGVIVEGDVHLRNLGKTDARLEQCRLDGHPPIVEL